MSQRYIGGLIYNPPGGYSGYFDGSGDSLTTASNAAFAFGSGDFTIECWMNAQAKVQSFPCLYGNTVSFGSNYVALQFDHDSATRKFRFWVYNANSSSPILETSGTYSYGSWYHVAVTRSGSTFRMFIDGVQVATATYAGSIDGGSSQVAKIGGNASSSDDFNGYISNSRLVKGTAVYTTAFTPPNGPLQNITNTSLLTCRYPTFVDGSSNAFTITVNGNTTVSTQNPFPLTTLPNPAQGGAGNGIFSMSQYQSLKQQNLWPAIDPYFDYTTLLLHGNGTNGGQNNTFLDSGTANSGSGFTITRNGNTTQGTFSPFSQTGWSNYLSNATGSYIVAANNTSYVFGTGDFTVEFWVFWTGIGTASDTRLMAIGSDYPSSGLGLVIYRTTGDTCKARVLGNSTGGTEYTIASGASDWSNKWVHMAVTRSGSTLRTFLNGTLITTATDSSDLNGTNGIQFGRYTGGGDLFTGYLSNVRLTKGGALYTASFTPPVISLTTTVSSGTVGFLGFQSNRFIDNSGNNIALTLTGTPSVQAFSPFAPTAAYSASTVGGSGYFDGSGDYLSVGSNAAFTLGTGDFTIECWYYPSVSYASGNGYLFDLGSNGTRIQLYLNTVYFLPVAGSSIQSAAGVGMSLGWHHVAAVRSGSTMTLYVDGVSAGTTTNSSNLTDTLCRIGSAGYTGDYFNGYISSFRIVKGTAVYTSAFTPPTAPLTNITNTSLLLNFTNAAIIDNTAKNVLETVGNAQISTTQSKFGGGSFSTGATSGANCLTAAASPLFQMMTGNFTVEGWFLPDSGTTGTERTFYIQGVNTTGGLALFVGTGGARFRANGQTDLVYSGTISSSVFTHIAFVRNGNTRLIFVNGTQVASDTLSFNNNDLTTVDIGAPAKNAQDVYRYYGYIDDLRITKGIARYTSNFTPQTSQWQDQ